MKLGIRGKILVITVTAFLLAVGVNTLVISRILRKEYSAALQSEIHVIANTLKSQIERLLGLGIVVDDIEGFEAQCQEVLRKHKDVAYVMVARIDGEILYHNDPTRHGAVIYDKEILRILEQNQQSACLSEIDEKTYYNMVVPLSGISGGHGVAVIVGFPASIIDDKLQTLLYYNLIVALASLGVAVFLLLTSLSISITRPLFSLVTTIRQIRDSVDLNKRVEVKSADEIGQLASSFNQMVEDLNETTVSRDSLAREVAERKRAEIELREAQERLVETAHKAGMAEVATDVLHNVGNVLNSINVSASLITERIFNSKAVNLEKIVGIIKEHINDLGTFLAEDPKGKQIPVYLVEVSKLLNDERTDVIDKLKTLTENVEHVKHIVSMQQSYSRVSGVEVSVSLDELIKDAIQINSAGLKRHGVEVRCDYPDLPTVEINKQKVLQILVNLIGNAKYAVSWSDSKEKLITIRFIKDDDSSFRLEVSDNGVGISRENLTKIFNHGFTTKKDGHGFGLHSGALAASEMGGTLTAHSDGEGKGATFTLELPFKPVKMA